MPKNQIFLLTAVVAIYSFLIYPIGFFSEDLDLLHRAQNQDFFLPLETHHYSFLINSLFHSRPESFSHPVLFHLLAILFHIINIALVAFILKRYLKLPNQIVFPIALLFAINLTGIEALTWCCALPYVVNTTLLLSSMVVYCSFQEGKRSVVSTAAVLSAILILGVINWEWIVLTVPILFACATLLEGAKVFRQKIMPILPLVGLLLIIYFVRNMLDLSTGYQMNTPVTAAGIMIASPFVGLFPFLPKEFYSSTEGIVAAAILFCLMIYLSIRSSQLRFFFFLFLASMIPTALQGHPQSRYFYFAMFPLYSFGILVIAKTAQFRLLFSFAYVTCLFMAIQRIQSWQKASEIVAASKIEIQSLIENNRGTVTVLNLPKNYGADQKIWRPPLWSGRFESFGGDLIAEEEDEQGTHMYKFFWTDEYNSYEIKRVEP